MLSPCRAMPLAAFLACAALAPPARATFSVVAADTAAGAIGSAGASCVPYEVIRILRVANRKGLLVGQAYFDDDALAEGEALLAAGEEPPAVLDAITDQLVFPNAPRMQYGIVDVEGRTASITGPEAKAYAADLAGSSGPVRFTVQGNLLTGPAVLEGMASAMGAGCDLPDRLVRALEAAGTDGGGDARCTDGGISAASAYVLVAWDDGTELRISLPDLRPDDPVAALRAALEEQRAEHPCPSTVPGPDDGPGDIRTDTGLQGGCALSPASPTSPHAGWLAGVAGLLGFMARIRRKAGRTPLTARPL